jgi:hypothetical protein
VRLVIHEKVDLGSVVFLSLSWDLVFIEPKKKLPPEGARTLKGRRKRKKKGREKEERKESDKEQSEQC